AIIMVIVSWKWKSIGRLLFVILFLWAAQFNLRTAISHPQEYLNYAPLAYSEQYKDFILGFFSEHITAIVGTIAIGQLLIGVSIGLRGLAVTLGLTGSIIFLVAIAPLGTGAGFPATLIMAYAAYLLIRENYELTLYQQFVLKFKARA
ncbi:MAG TPA: hypothetical protein VKA34_23255, partial [Balneolales bacterium]|nr:hypothetical protein [Balneolales bacterium]